jgi:hypothetical protein
MHACVVDVEIHDPDAARRGLEQIVPAVKQAPGFVAGYWVRPVKGPAAPSPCSRPRIRPVPRHRRWTAALPG